jgi:predicted RNA binding protein YcfA (HicA-like mRNA interferase family)
MDTEGNRMKVRDVLKKLREDGWYPDTTEGSHRHFKHDQKPGKVTVAGHPSDDIPPKTLKRIYEQAGWGKP